MNLFANRLLLLLAAILLATTSFADPGFDNDVRAITTYNGDLIVGGYFNNAAGFNSIKAAGYDGSDWYSMSGFPNGNPIYWLHVHSGVLYAGQALTQLCGWDGSSWTGYNPWLGNTFGNIWALESFNNELYVGGGFDGNASQPSYIARWNGASWDTVGTGIQGIVRVLHVHNGQLIAGGYFTIAAGSVGNRIAAWNGSVWSPLGDGLDGGVQALTTYNSELIAAGSFTNAGGNPASRIARWNGSTWQPLGSGFDGTVEALYVLDNKLIAGGRFANSGTTSMPFIASWDGSSWSGIGTAIDDDVYGLGEFAGYLVAGGAFTAAGGYVALWDGSTWRPVADISTDVEEGVTGTLPDGYELGQNYPNPFNPATVIEYTLPKTSHVKLDILNINGQFVKQLIDRELSYGTHQTSWNGTNDAGDRVSSGMYFYRLTVDGHAASRKMILLK